MVRQNEEQRELAGTRNVRPEELMYWPFAGARLVLDTWLGLLGDIDHAATAFADSLQQFVATDAVPGFFGERLGRQRVWRRSEFNGHIRIGRVASLIACPEIGPKLAGGPNFSGRSRLR